MMSLDYTLLALRQFYGSMTFVEGRGLDAALVRADQRLL
jgi:hypothetical protein